MYTDENTCIRSDECETLGLVTRANETNPEECFSAEYCSEEEGGFVDPTGTQCVESCFGLTKGDTKVIIGFNGVNCIEISKSCENSKCACGVDDSGVVYNDDTPTPWDNINGDSKCACDSGSTKKILSLDGTKCVDKCNGGDEGYQDDLGGGK